MPDEREPYEDKLAGVEGPELELVDGDLEGVWAVLSPTTGLLLLPDIPGQQSGRDQAMAIALLPGWSVRQLRGGKWEPTPVPAAEWLARLGTKGEPDAETAVMVLGFFEGVGAGGIPPGDFFRSLIDAICRADPGNIYRLQAGFPRLVATVRLYLETDGGREHLIGLIDAYRQSLGLGRKAAGG